MWTQSVADYTLQPPSDRVHRRLHRLIVRGHHFLGRRIVEHWLPPLGSERTDSSPVLADLLGVITADHARQLVAVFTNSGRFVSTAHEFAVVGTGKEIADFRPSLPQPIRR